MGLYYQKPFTKQQLADALALGLIDNISHRLLDHHFRASRELDSINAALKRGMGDTVVG
jgi:hypothetical protein